MSMVEKMSEEEFLRAIASRLATTGNAHYQSPAAVAKSLEDVADELASLRARLAEAEGEVDAIAHAIGVCYDHDHGCGGAGPIEEVIRAAKEGNVAKGQVIELTRSLDAALATIEAVRREWGLWRTGGCCDGVCTTMDDAIATILSTAPRSNTEARLTELEARTKGQVKYGGVLSGTSPRSASEETLERVREAMNDADWFSAHENVRAILGGKEK